MLAQPAESVFLNVIFRRAAGPDLSSQLGHNTEESEISISGLRLRVSHVLMLQNVYSLTSLSQGHPPFMTINSVNVSTGQKRISRKNCQNSTPHEFDPEQKV